MYFKELEFDWAKLEKKEFSRLIKFSNFKEFILSLKNDTKTKIINLAQHFIDSSKYKNSIAIKRKMENCQLVV